MTEIENSKNSETEKILLFITFLIGLSLGIDKYYSVFFNINSLIAVPLCFFFCIALAPFSKFSFLSKKVLFSQFLFLLLYGFFIAAARYNYNYKFLQMDLFPTLRQSIAFFVGFTLYISFKEIHKYFNLKLISEIFILASIPAIALGVFQYFHGQKIFGFERIQSFFSEPSYYGDYLVLLLLPCLIKTFENFWHAKVTRKLFLIIYLITLIFSLYATQSGTSILKTLSLLLLSFMFFKIKKRYKILAGTFAIIIIAGIIYLKNGYIKEVTSRGIEILQNPDLFFKHHNYYDRFYPIYVSIIKLFSFEGVIGLGFGGDYFEFKNLFPASTHAEMMIHKPTFSYFNSFASKIILYFGIFGLAWLALQFYKAGKCKNDIIKIACLNVLISSLWGVSSFALPYIWFWLALVDLYYERLDHQS